MATIVLPTTPKFTSATFNLLRADVPIELLSGAEVIMAFRKAVWVYSFALPAMKIADGRIWSSRLTQLSNLSNTFNATPPEYDGPGTGYSGASPLVMGAGQLGRSLACDGVTASTAILLEGDYFSVNGELKKLTANATSDGSGNVTFAFEPALRKSPANNAAVNIATPSAVFRLAAPEASWDVNAMVVFGLSVAAVESFGP